ncbi:MAG: aspartate kinase [Candidatus Nanopelagicales bacterium]
MGLVVQKYGGSSVADAASVRRVAGRIVDTVAGGDQVVVVVSAMGDSTDDLIDLAQQVSPDPPARELDMLLTAGERISMAVLAMAIADLGHQARSYTGSQAGLITDGSHGSAKIIDVTPGRITGALADGAIPIVAGFQGVSQDTKDVTTLGRGGSDTTAVALAAALGADACEIYTDVDGVFSADPRIVPKARHVPTMTYEEMLELAAHGAKVLHLRCVEYARRSDIPLRVRSSFTTSTGTLVTSNSNYDRLTAQAEAEGVAVEQPIISGVAHDVSEAKITITSVPDEPGRAAAVFESLADAGVNLDMIVQNVSADGQTDITFTLPMADGSRAMAALEISGERIGFESLIYDDAVAKVSLVGAAMRSHPGVSATCFRALADAGVNVEMISTSEIRISVVTRLEDATRAVQAIHTAFGLDADGEAVIYAGTGR